MIFKYKEENTFGKLIFKLLSSAKFIAYIIILFHTTKKWNVVRHNEVTRFHNMNIFIEHRKNEAMTIMQMHKDRVPVCIFIQHFQLSFLYIINCVHKLVF